MQLNVRDLAAKKRRFHLRETFPVGDLFRERRDVAGCGPVETDLTIEAVSGVVEVSGTLSAGVEYVCSRCLSPYCQKLTVPFAESFTLEPELADEDNDRLHVLDEDKVDLRPYVEETLLLAIPYVPICRDECKGLTTSGVNRNVYPEAEDEVRIDPRLAALADWFKEE